MRKLITVAHSEIKAKLDADNLIPLDVDEEPEGTFWRRI
jgi:hypothetical protein